MQLSVLSICCFSTLKKLVIIHLVTLLLLLLPPLLSRVSTNTLIRADQTVFGNRTTAAAGGTNHGYKNLSPVSYSCILLTDQSTAIISLWGHYCSLYYHHFSHTSASCCWTWLWAYQSAAQMTHGFISGHVRTVCPRKWMSMVMLRFKLDLCLYHHDTLDADTRRPMINEIKKKTISFLCYFPVLLSA